MALEVGDLRRQGPGARTTPYTVYGHLVLTRSSSTDKGWKSAETWDGLPRPARRSRPPGSRPGPPPGKYPHYMQLVTDADMAVKYRRPRGRSPRSTTSSRTPGSTDAIKTAADALRRDRPRATSWPGHRAGLDHIQSPDRLVRGQGRAFIPSGSWLENEQKKVTPPDFDMTVAPTPDWAGSTSCRSRRSGAPPASRSSCPPRPRTSPGGLEYLRIMLSKKGGRRTSPSSRAGLTVVAGRRRGPRAAARRPASASELVKAGAGTSTGSTTTSLVPPAGAQGRRRPAASCSRGRHTPDEFLRPPARRAPTRSPRTPRPRSARAASLRAAGPRPRSGCSMRHGQNPFIVAVPGPPLALYAVFVISPYLQALPDLDHRLARRLARRPTSSGWRTSQALVHDAFVPGTR